MQTPLSNIPCSSSSRAKQSIHSSNSLPHHHDQVSRHHKYNHSFPQHCFDGGACSTHRCCIGCPVSSISLRHNPSSLPSSSSAALRRSVTTTAFNNPLSSSSSSSSSSSYTFCSPSPLSPLFLNNPFSSLALQSFHSPSAAGSSLKCSATNSPFSSSTSSSSSTLPSSHIHSMGSSMRQAGKCNCNLLSQAKHFITEQLGMNNKNEDADDDEDEEELSEGSPQSAIKLPKQREGSQASMGALAQRWRELQGLNHWEGLLDPLDLELRRCLLFYGDFNQAVYDSFETDAHSKYTGACRFAKEDFFEGVRLVQGREVQYDVVRYLYATSSTIDIHGLVFMKSYSREAWSRESNWIGYMAVSNDEATKLLGRRDIVIVWRGTQRPFEWLDDFKFRQADVTPLLPPSSQQTKNKSDDDDDDGGGDVPSIEQGWLNIYTTADSKSAFSSSSARDQVFNEVKVQLNKYKDENVSITILGHSLGAALAVVNAFDIAVNKLNVREGKETTLVTAFVFGCPSVGDEAFVKKCEELEGLRVLRIKNKIDLITKYPGWLMGYRDVGDELLFDSQDSTYLKKSKAPGDWHNLEVHLHMVAGMQGVGKPFKFTVNRDVALINKSSEALRDDFLIPGSWWQMQYKGLVQREDGFWHMPDREEGKRPKPEPLNDESLVSRG